MMDFMLVSATLAGRGDRVSARRVMPLVLATIMTSSNADEMGMTRMCSIPVPVGDGEVIMVIRLATRESSSVVCRNALRRSMDLDRNVVTFPCRVLERGMMADRWLMKHWQFPLAGTWFEDARGRTRHFLLLRDVTLPWTAVESMLRLRPPARVVDFTGLRD